MTVLTATQLLGVHAPPRPGPAGLADGLGGWVRRLVAAGRHGRPARRLGDLPDRVLRDIGLSHADLDALDRPR
jgi:uncharacterized protein YjiS (DUF1127 family)